MNLPRNPRFRLFVRLVTYITLKSFALGIAESLMEKRSFSHSLDVAQAYALGGMLFFGIAMGVIGVVIALVFGYEPNARRFKLVMAIAVVALPAIFIIADVNDLLRYPNSHDLSDLFLPLAHAAVSVWISQIAARKYLAEQHASLQQGKT